MGLRNARKKIQDKLFKTKMKYCTRNKRERIASRWTFSGNESGTQSLKQYLIEPKTKNNLTFL